MVKIIDLMYITCASDRFDGELDDVIAEGNIFLIEMSDG